MIVSFWWSGEGIAVVLVARPRMMACLQQFSHYSDFFAEHLDLEKAHLLRLVGHTQNLHRISNESS